jgi:RNA polymerase sigma-70 factor (ECF subfamily)
MSKKYRNESKLVAKAKAGDKQAITQIVNDNERLVYNTALKLLANEEEAECVLQETFLKVLEALPNFKEQSSISTWIYRIATNFALMRLRSRKKTVGDMDDVEMKTDSISLDAFNQSIGDNPLNTVLNNELKRFMDIAIKELSPKYRTVFILKDIEGRSLKEIAEMLDLTLAAVKSNLHRARLYLRDKLAEFYERKTATDFKDY